MDNANTRGLPYDYSSVMHYGGNTFAKPGTKTIVTKDPTKQSLIGNTWNGLSHLDAKLINMMYNCPSKYSQFSMLEYKEQESTTYLMKPKNHETK